MDDALLSSKAMDWRTPPALFQAIENLSPFPFTLDAAAQLGHELCPRFIGPGGVQPDALTPAIWAYWGTGRTFMNPPYGRQLSQFTKAAIWQAQQWPGRDVWLLVPARVDTRWWNELTEHAFGIWFVKGRVKFLLADGTEGDAAPFPSAVVAIDGLRERRRGAFVEWAWNWPSSLPSSGS